MKFDEPNALSDVSAFHEIFNMPVLQEPTIPQEQRCKLRVNLLAEELEELQEAIEQKDIVGIADALCDLQYVLSGAVLEFGLADKFKALFDEVQRSNMSKVCRTMEEAEATVEKYRREKDTEGEIVQRDGVYLVFRKSDRKVLKSVGYSEADLESIVHG